MVQKRKLVIEVIRSKPTNKPQREKKQGSRVLHIPGKKLLVVALCGSLGACSGTALNGDQFRLSGTPEGIEAFSDMMIGQATEAKNPQEMKSPYWQNRDQKLILRFKNRGQK